MKTSDFFYALPDALIAQSPPATRTESRFLSLNSHSGAIADYRFHQLPALLKPGDLLVFNDTRVINARLYGLKSTGGKVEILIERVLDDRQALAQLRSNKPLKPGAEIMLADDIRIVIEGRFEDFHRIAIHSPHTFDEVMDQCGHVPLPPYIVRPDGDADMERYQTVYSRAPGAVAAPTAGLHFDQELLDRISALGVQFAHVTLHVGAGTFKPIRVENLKDHKMHKERFEVPVAVCDAVKACRARKGRVIAVGTTSVRALESAAISGELSPTISETDLFITPGSSFHVVDSLITNFHLPESTLLMLVCAFGGFEPVMTAYRHAVENSYRFFSYGDAMMLDCTAKPEVTTTSSID